MQLRKSQAVLIQLVKNAVVNMYMRKKKDSDNILNNIGNKDSETEDP